MTQARSRHASFVALALVVLGLVALLTGAAAADPPSTAITYGYDELGRLVAVSDPANGAAKYNYDAAGNLTSIVRQAVTVVSISSFSPSSGSAGTTVTIYGTGFSATASQDTVKFAGTTATVTSASATVLVATVPTGAASGTISVTAPGGTATSSGSFSVSGGPSITGVSAGIAAVGASVTVTGTGFDTTAANDVVLLDGVRAPVTTASATSLTVTAPTATAGEVTVATPRGTAVSGSDLVVPPSPYGANDVTATARIAVGGSTSISVGANKVSVVMFDATGGQRLAINLGDVNMGAFGNTGVTYTLVSAGGGVISPLPVEFGNPGAFIEPFRVAQSGTYAVVIDPDGANSGSLTVSAYSVPNDVTGTLTAGTASTATVTTAGQNVRYTFSGNQNDRISLNIDNVTLSGSQVLGQIGATLTILNPDGSPLVNGTSFGTAGKFVDATTLPQSGTYVVFVDPAAEATGSLRLTLYNVPADDSGTITIGGPSITSTISTPGQNGSYTFTGTTGKNINLALTNINYPSLPPTVGATVAIYGSTNNTVLAPTDFGHVDKTVSATLPADDTYRIAIDPGGPATGTLTMTLTDPPGSPVRRATGLAGFGALPLLVQSNSKRTARAHRDPRAAARAADPSTRVLAASDGPEEWTPGPSNRAGDWTTHRGRSLWQAYPPLEAPTGVTAIAGQTLILNGEPLAGVTVELEGVDRSATTDDTGRFVLTTADAGHHVLIVDGSTAGTAGKQYGRFEIGVDLKRGVTTPITDTIWMTQLDKGHEVSLDSPTTQPVVITNPHIPGLELRLQAGTKITDEDGNPISKVSITPVPVDKPPFPLPLGVSVPLYFTIQPGGAYLSKPAELIYPNYTHLPPGQRVAFWNYDPDEKGWYIYGQGTVSGDASQVVPDADTRIWSFTGAMISGSLIPPGLWPKGGSKGGDPVDLSSGLFVYEKSDLVEPGPAPIALTRTYRQSDTNSYSFGIGETNSYDMRLWSQNNYVTAELILPDGGRVHFQRISPGTSYTDAVYDAQTSSGPFLHSKLSWNQAAFGFDLTTTDGTVYSFADNAPLQSIHDRYGNRITFTRRDLLGNLSKDGDITEIRSSSGRWIQLTYDSSHRVTQAKDSAGRTVNYAYYTASGTGELQSVTDARGGTTLPTVYTYDASHELKTLKDPRGIVFLTVDYYGDGRVQKQTQNDGTTFQFAYSTDGNGNPQTDVTDPKGNVKRVVFNSDGYPTSETDAYGTSLAETTSYERQAGTGILTAEVDPLGHRTELGHDSLGNVTSITRMAGTNAAAMTSFTYDPALNQLKTVTDPLTHTTTYGYDDSQTGAGALTSITDPLTHQTSIVPDGTGQPAQVQDALTHTTTYGYLDGDLVSTTDPIGRTTKRLVDNGGRLIALTDPLGTRTSYQYDALNALTKVTDAKAGQTSYGYDGNDNLTSITDPLTHAVQAYTYDNLDRLQTKKDGLLHQETYAYDNNGNLTSVTDRKGQVTTYRYDAINRRTFAGFGTTGTPPNQAFTSTINYGYDSGNRLLSATDSISGGSVSESYDDLNRQTTETQGTTTISYTYDAAGRRTAMTVTGQPTVNYGYYDDNRLNTVQQGSATVTLVYDNGGRRTSVTLPDGIQEVYGFDDASQLTGVTYKLNGNTLGDLNYGYDAAGKRTAVWGSYARTNLPAALSSATYNAANQLTKWANHNVSIDANGSLTNDSLGQTYTWDNRGQLASTSKTGTSVSYGYDALGRRRSVTVNGSTTTFLFDGQNVVQEQSTGSTINLLTGLGVDETFARTDPNVSGSQRSFLTDALGSTVALGDTNGTVATSYTYEPFGKATTSGASSTNGFQFTGRQSDANGLVQLRARSYSTTLQRFLSEDPSGPAGSGSNLYAYVSNSPTNLVDPTGLCGLSLSGLLHQAIGRCGAFAAIGFWSMLIPGGAEFRIAEEALVEARGLEEAAQAAEEAAQAAEGARGLSPLGGVIEQTGTNAAGGRIFTSTGAINQNDFAGIVNSGLMRGEEVHILTGAHGLADGSLVADPSLLAADLGRFGSLPRVSVHDLPSMSPEEVSAILQGPGTIIGGFCESGACLAPFGG